jgi:antitoxin component YwqK of YwqJK toxin-antitoxin module
MRITLQSNKDNDDQAVNIDGVDPNKIKNSEYFAGIIDCCNCDSVLFPSQYRDVFDIYINFISGNYLYQDEQEESIVDDVRPILPRPGSPTADYTALSPSTSLSLLPQPTNKIKKREKYDCYYITIDIDSDELKRAFELCHFLADNNFFNFLLHQLFDAGWTNKHQHIVNSVHDSIRYEIYLHTPYALLPVDYQVNLNFLVNWAKINNHKYIYVDKQYVYKSNVYFDNNKNISSIESWYSKQVVPNFFTNHGCHRYWYSPVNDGNGNKKQQLLSEHSYLYGDLYGHCNNYRRDGGIGSSTHHRNGINGGICQEHKVYYDNDQMTSSCQYDNNGKKDGIWTQWYKSGRLKSEISYKNGIKHGHYRKYFDSEEHHTEHEYCFENGLETGTFREWTYNEITDVYKLKYQCTYHPKDSPNVYYCYQQWNSDGKLVVTNMVASGTETTHHFMPIQTSNDFEAEYGII